MLPGHPSDPMAKVSGDNSMAEKRGVGEHARPAAPQDLRDMAKAGLLEAQSPSVNVRTRRNDACNRRPHPAPA